MPEESYGRGLAGECLREALSSTSEYTELFPSNPLYAEMSGLCPRIDYRLQWGNDGEVLVNLLTLLYHTASQAAKPGSGA